MYMLDSFKITAKKLKRILKVHISLPDKYNECDDTYPLIIALDGELLFNFLNEDTKRININTAIKEYNDKCIIVALQAPKLEAWRMSELNPYYNGEDKTVDPILSYIFFDYIAVELIPMLKESYRFNDDIYLLGFNEGGIASLNMVYRYPIFKGAGLFNPAFSSCSTKLIADLNKYFNENKKIYIYHGENIAGNDNTIYYVSAEIKKKAPAMVQIDMDSSSSNSYLDFEEHLYNYFSFILDEGGN